MVKIRKLLAKKMYYQGHTITLVPCKCSVDNTVAKSEIEMFCGDIDPLTLTQMFDTKVNTFEYYNCNKELGTYTHFYVTEKSMEQFELCKMLCG